ncbi:CLUMA_CG010054, isoform A [Clunio marinus]|uniref:CLUMA_CG010054, isoform A n=1 Tax=Clunio marinus TaxID=568069 RepID=A0A1J1IDX6_9DIPT|nr:CLUMA_CG010054, isoform A [Clunio marinus]
MNLLRLMFTFHKARRYAKSKAEPAFQIFRKHPITRGMASYLFIWPFGNTIQQIMSDQEKFDYWKIVRFGIYGALITAPSLYAWVKISTAMYPNANLRIACAKALIEQITYTPFAMTTFFFSMTWLETFSAAEAWAEVKTKFIPSYCIAITIWPVIGTINFAFIPERNRVLFVSCFSLLWTVYLAHVKNLERDKMMLTNKTKELENEK